jgi:hypothetical protein
MSDDLLRLIRGWRCPADQNAETFRRLLRRPAFDQDGYMRAQRIHGIAQCPDCGLWWPLIEEVEAWVAGTGEHDGKWIATEWGPGTAECIECGCIVVDTFDGCFVIRP